MRAWPLGVKPRLSTALRLSCPEPCCFSDPAEQLIVLVQIPGAGVPDEGLEPLAPRGGLCVCDVPSPCVSAAGARVRVRSCLCPSSPPPFLYSPDASRAILLFDGFPEGVLCAVVTPVCPWEEGS